jgi:hypothetical protein
MLCVYVIINKRNLLLLIDFIFGRFLHLIRQLGGATIILIGFIQLLFLTLCYFLHILLTTRFAKYTFLGRPLLFHEIGNVFLHYVFDFEAKEHRLVSLLSGLVIK